jgi:transcriptional regulator with XRE-family HTH domain
MAYSPTVRRRIARELRRLRQRNNLTLDTAAKGLDMSKSNLSRIENREVGIKPRDVRAALAFYGVTGEAAETIIEISRRGEQRRWWQDYSKVLPDWFQFYVGLEDEASGLCTYESEVVPGLFQTPEYARAVSSATDPDAGADKRVEARLRRQQVLTGDNPIEISAILNEAVLLRPMGGRQVLRGQLERLLELADLPHVTIQVLPFSSGSHPALQTPYILLAFPDPEDESVVHLDNITFGVTLEDEKHVAAYTLIHSELRRQALSPKRSKDRLHEASRSVE